MTTKCIRFKKVSTDDVLYLIFNGIFGIQSNKASDFYFAFGENCDFRNYLFSIYGRNGMNNKKRGMSRIRQQQVFSNIAFKH